MKKSIKISILSICCILISCILLIAVVILGRDQTNRILSSIANPINRIITGSRWVTSEWGNCKEPCGDSIKIRSVDCLDNKNNQSPYCDVSKKPSNQISCNLGDCGEWITGKWSDCSKKCNSGIQTREIKCESNGKPSVCSNKDKPVSEESCNNFDCGSWQVGSWSECNPKCGTGNQNRIVLCKRNDGTVATTCDDKQPPTTQTCINPTLCANWKTGEWGQCSATCGGGTQTRSVSCIDTNGNISTNCLETKPNTTQPCNTQACGRWATEPWGGCTVNCGGGWQYRNVYCLDQNNLRTADSNCLANQKPITSQLCNTQSCPPPPPPPAPATYWYSPPPPPPPPQAPPPPLPDIPRGDRCTRSGWSKPGTAPTACKTVSGRVLWFQYGKDNNNPFFNENLPDYNGMNVWCWNCPAGIFDGGQPCWYI
jgi:thrombospondin motif-containing protein 9